MQVPRPAYVAVKVAALAPRRLRCYEHDRHKEAIFYKCDACSLAMNLLQSSRLLGYECGSLLGADPPK